MTLTARVPAAIDAAGFVPEIWSKDVIEPARKQLVCLPNINAGWKKQLSFGDTLNVPVTNTTVAVEVVVGSEGAVQDFATGAMLPIIVNQWWQVPIRIDDMTIQQQHVDLYEFAKKETIYGLKVKIDSTIATLFSTLNGGVVLGTDGSAIIDEVLIEAWETLMEADVPPDNIALIVDPSGIADFYSQEKLVNAQYGAGAPISAGFKGFHKVYGCPVFMTNNLTAVSAGTGSYACMLHKDAIGAIMSQEVKINVKPFEEKFYTLVLSQALWGLKVMRNTWGIPIYTRKA